MVNKLTLPAKQNEVVNKVNELVDDKQDTLVSGTNIKTINNQSILGSGNIEIQGGGGAYTAGDGIDITSDTISIKSSIINGAELGTTALQVGDNISDLNNDSGYIQNVATDPGSLAILGSIAPNVWDSISIGKDSVAAGPGVLAIGYEAIASGYYAIQLGRGTNSTDYSFSVGFAGVNFQLLDGTTGLIPDARISSNIARSADIPTTTSDLTNDSGFITSSALNGYATENWVNNKGYLTGINSSDVTSALGYTPYNATNPNGYITSSALSGYALDTDVVHLTGDESVNGDKTFNDVIISRKSGDPAITCDDPAKIKGTAPSSSKNTVIRFRDKDGKNLGAIYHSYGTDKRSMIAIQVSKASSSSDTAYAQMVVYYPASGDPYTYAPPSDVNDSIVTTVNKSKATNGYFQLGNGMIVNWGAVSSWTSNAAQVTFSKAFTTTRQVAIARSAGATTTNDGGDYYVRGISNTGFGIYRTSTNTGGVSWIAIGY